MVQSIFSTYSQGENRITASIIQVLKNLPVNVVEHFLRMFSQTDAQEFLRFKNQVKGSESTPDAEISANFTLLFETKVVPNRIGISQLRKHAALAKERNAILVYLTPDQSRPEILNGHGVVWKSFQDLHNLISELIQEPTLILSERDQFLLRNLQDLFSESNLLPRVNEVVVVAASAAWPTYQKHGVYVCQAERSFRDVSLLAFYADGKIQKPIAKIADRYDNFDFSDKNLTTNPVLNSKLSGWLVDNLWAQNGALLQVFDLSTINCEDTIMLKSAVVNDLRNSDGRGYAYTQGQRYVALSDLQAAQTTSDLYYRNAQ